VSVFLWFGPKLFICLAAIDHQKGHFSNSLFSAAGSTLYSPDSVNPSASVNRESLRDFAFLDGVGTRKWAILDVGRAGRDAKFESAVNKKAAKP
jgi:hypothetical protein